MCENANTWKDIVTNEIIWQQSWSDRNYVMLLRMLEVGIMGSSLKINASFRSLLRYSIQINYTYSDIPLCFQEKTQNIVLHAIRNLNNLFIFNVFRLF